MYVSKHGAGFLNKLINGVITRGERHGVDQKGSGRIRCLRDAVDLNVHAVVRSGLADIEVSLKQNHERSKQELDTKGLLKLEKLHQQIDAHDGWHLEQRVETTMTELNLPADKMMSELSGGWRRRVALAKALVQKPDLLLLDEPTNHLDVITIKWLENIVYSYAGSVLFITHDRAYE